MKEKLKGFFNILKSRILLIISICFSFTMLGYFISSNFICDISYNSYTVECRYSESLSNYEDLINQDSLEYAKSLIIEIRQEAIDNGEKAPYSDFSYVDIKSLMDGGIIIRENDDSYLISTKKEEFNSLAQARRFIKTLFENENVIEDRTYEYNDPICIEENIIFVKNLVLTLTISLISSVLLCFVILFIVYVKKPLWFNDKHDYDNENLYKHPFKKSLFKKSIKTLTDIRCIVMISILFALQMTLKQISIPTGLPNLNINLGTLIFPIISMVFGPIPGMMVGMLSDVIGFMIKPNGPFFPGYTLNAMLSGLFYAFCLYKTKVTFTKCLMARLLVGILVNAIIGSLWTNMIYGMDYNLALSISLFKNLLFLFPQAIIMFVTIKLIIPIFKRTKFLSIEFIESISVF